jgi:hypothetical protein
VVDAGPPIDGGDAGTKCSQFTVQESEVNDDVANADPIPNETGTYCGSITSAGDVDFITFTLPASLSRLRMGYETTNGAAIQVDATADGEAFPFNGTYLIKPSKPYVLKVSSKNGQLFDYLIKVEITP